jgi:hypothetical protein
MNKTTIYYDSRGAGQGKTRTGIYPGIKFALRIAGAPVLVVVPSVRLQQQYLEDLPECIRPEDVINSEPDPVSGRRHTDNVSRRIIDQMVHRDEGVILITHEAFIRTQIPRSIRQRWILIVDEAMTVWNYEKINLTTAKSWNPQWDFKNLFYWDRPAAVIPEDDVPWHKLCVSSTPTEQAFTDSPQFQRLTSGNQELYCKWNSYQRLCQNDTGHADLVLSLDPAVFSDWGMIKIAAAAFEHTFMYLWFEHAGFELECQNEFVRRLLPVRIHTIDWANEQFLWSNRKRQANPEILQEYHAYVRRNLPPDILVVRNNSELASLATETRLTHNVHGMNNHTQYRAVSLETALVMNPVMMDFLTTHVDMTQRACVAAFSAYTFYQILMRTALRLQNNQATVDVALLDHATAIELGTFMDWNVAKNTLQTIQISYRPRTGGRPRGRRNSRPAQTGAERTRRSRERQRLEAEQLAKMALGDPGSTFKELFEQYRSVAK